MQILSVKRLRESGVLQPRVAALGASLAGLHEPSSAGLMPVDRKEDKV